jgi:hypothetical protein
MKIFGGEMSQVQIEAGLATMKGEFSSTTVMTALSKAGVKACLSGAQTLIRRELRTGHIERITRGIYRKL